MHFVGLYQDTEANHDPAQRAGGESSGKHKQYSDDSRVTKTSKGQHPRIDLLLENLGFILHPEKSITTPSQEMEFLGMEVHSQTIKLRLPEQKLRNLRTEVAKYLNSETAPTTGEVSSLLGKLNSVFQAVPPCPLFCRMLQRDLARALDQGNQLYETPCRLSAVAREELTWWTEQLTKWNGKSLVLRKPDLSLESDASLQGWRASCQGIRTGGPWSP